MLKINKNTTNSLVFTLNEKVTLENPNFLLELYSNQNHDSTVMRLSGDTSTNVIRYNEFNITETTTSDLENMVVNLDEGTYDYYVWETSGSTLELSGATSIVESGKVVVKGSGSTQTTFENNDKEYTFE